jgi:predicted metal-dependent HD superfamily phosphohydrolase
VYEPRRTDNEERSAEVAAAELGRLGIDPAEVVRLVLLTREHLPQEGDRAGAALCDADLTVLAAGQATYDRYSAAVRAEYANLDDAAWARGRSSVLTGLLDRPRLFHTERGRECEEPARANLRRELAALERTAPQHPHQTVTTTGASDGAARLR